MTARRALLTPVRWLGVAVAVPVAIVVVPLVELAAGAVGSIGGRRRRSTAQPDWGAYISIRDTRIASEVDAERHPQRVETAEDRLSADTPRTRPRGHSR